MRIRNGSSILINQQSGSLPNVSSAMKNWFQTMVFEKVTKTVVAHRVVETKEEITFRGVMQIMKPQELQIKPEGQRDWSWKTIHSDVDLALSPDDIILYLGVRYRVMKKEDYSIYGYFKYDAVEDYNGNN